MPTGGVVSTGDTLVLPHELGRFVQPYPTLVIKRPAATVPSSENVQLM